MKKFLKFILVLFIIFTVLPLMSEGCSNAKLALSHDRKDIIGTFESIQNSSGDSISQKNSTITFNANGTYDMSPMVYKGTYVVSVGYVGLDGDLQFDYGFLDDHYLYNTSEFYLTEDDDYGLEPTFDDNGRTEQRFSYYYADSFTLAKDPSTGRLLEGDDGSYIKDMNYREIIFDFNDDGTYKIEERVNDGLRNLISEGTYQLKDNILCLNYDGGSMPLIYDNDKIYFDVYEKQE
ncbi:MAG: hypothetical protein UDB11_04875 [Peptococcaceae bacterium]|nr:hypothetical protein [Peptococcaceae bacterium]